MRRISVRTRDGLKGAIPVDTCKVTVTSHRFGTQPKTAALLGVQRVTITFALLSAPHSRFSTSAR